MTNSIKHAFSGRSKGTISIKLDREAEKLILAVHDDGKGFEGDFFGDWNHDHSRARAAVGGELEWERGSGTTVRLAVPLWGQRGSENARPILFAAGEFAAPRGRDF